MPYHAFIHSFMVYIYSTAAYVVNDKNLFYEIKKWWIWFNSREKLKLKSESIRGGIIQCDSIIISQHFLQD